ncbi:putative glycoside hydrolase [bacterium]|nr:putative glycoside hydrolase [bacterium]
MSIPYRTRRVLNRLGSVLLVLLLISVVAWLCWVIWLQRYVVYTDDGATLDFSRSSNEVSGEVATPMVASANIPIYYNEGANAINTSNELTQLNGYYITSEMFQNDLDNVLLQVARLPAGTPVMIDMKGPYGSFFYSSKLSDAVISQSTNISAVEDLVSKLRTKGFYTIARISAFRDRSFGDTHVSSGLYMLSRAGLWMDQGGMYWLDPTNATATTWIASVVLELKEMGFDEVLLADFCFPNSDKYIFNGDKDAALQQAAATLMSSCGAENFTLSFCVDNAAFPLPEGRCRLYMEGVDAGGIQAKASQVTFDDPEIRLVFLSENGDTRYDQYGVLRSLYVAEEVEARKENQ